MVSTGSRRCLWQQHSANAARANPGHGRLWLLTFSVVKLFVCWHVMLFCKAWRVITGKNAQTIQVICGCISNWKQLDFVFFKKSLV